MEKAVKCRKCGALPYITKIEDCFYAKCSKCTKWAPYEFLGITPKAAIRNWNESNSRASTSKEKENNNEDD